MMFDFWSHSHVPQESSYAFCSGLACLPTFLKGDLTWTKVAEEVHSRVRE